MKGLLAGIMMCLLVGCSSVNVVYTSNGVTDNYQIDTQGSHTIVLSEHEVTITSN